MDVERPAAAHQRVPHLDGAIPRHPDLVAEIARVAGARDVDRHAGDRPLVMRKYLRCRCRRRPPRASSRAEVGPCSASAATCSEMSSIAHVETDGVLREPAQVRIGGGPAVRVLRQPRHRPVVDHLAVLVAPRRVVDLPDGELRRVARDDAIDEPGRVAAADAVLEERRDVDERRRVADRVVLVLVMRFVRADRVVARPLAEIQAFAQRERALVNGGPDRHKRIIEEPQRIKRQVIAARRVRISS